MLETCPRCDATLPFIDGAAAAFCGNCGLPQLRVTSELAEPNPYTATQDAVSDVPGLDWALMLRLCAVASLAGVVLCVVLPGALSSGAAASLALFLLPVLVLSVGFLYLRRRPAHRMSASTGARVGVVIALFVLAGVTFVSAITGFVLRYRYHSHALEQSVDLQMAQLEAQMRGMAAGPSTDAILAALKTPEWCAGMFLWIQLIAAVLLLAAGAICGALAGALLRARQRRNQPLE